MELKSVGRGLLVVPRAKSEQGKQTLVTVQHSAGTNHPMVLRMSHPLQRSYHECILSYCVIFHILCYYTPLTYFFHFVKIYPFYLFYTFPSLYSAHFNLSFSSFEFCSLTEFNYFHFNVSAP